MPAFTTNLDLYLPGGGSLGIGGADEAADIDRVNQNMQKIDVWSESVDTSLGNLAPLLVRNQQFTGLTANIDDVVGAKLGDEYQETDLLKRLWRHDGTNWVTDENGMFLIRPTSVAGTGVTLLDGGKVSFASSPAVNINGVFSTRFSSYLVVLNVKGVSVALGGTWRLRAAGVDATGVADYKYQQTYGTANTVTTAYNSGSAFGFATAVGLKHNAEFMIFEPAVAVTTRVLSSGNSVSPTSMSEFRYGGDHILAAAYDGLSFIASTGNMTGTISIYGLL